MLFRFHRALLKEKFCLNFSFHNKNQSNKARGSFASTKVTIVVDEDERISVHYVHEKAARQLLLHSVVPCMAQVFAQGSREMREKLRALLDNSIIEKQ